MLSALGGMTFWGVIWNEEFTVLTGSLGTSGFYTTGTVYELIALFDAALFLSSATDVS